MSDLFLALIVFLSPPSNQKWNGEDVDEALARYHVIAEAVTFEAGKDRRLALFMLATGKHESGFAIGVHAGKVRGDGGRSWGLFQLMCGKRPTCRIPGTSFEAREIVGVDLDSTRRSAKAAATHLRIGIEKCGGVPSCVFRRYVGGKVPATDPRIRARVNTYLRLTAEAARVEP
jgi:hypothetical protein